MANHEHTPHAPVEQAQAAIDADGGLYDQAVREDAERTQRRVAQDEAYATYEENIEVSEYLAEYRENDQRIEALKKEKRKLIWREIGGLAMWIPGLDVVGEMIQQSRTSANLHKERRQRYKQKNGSIGINLQKRWEAASEQRGERRAVIEELSDLLEERRQRGGNLTGRD